MYNIGNVLNATEFKFEMVNFMFCEFHLNKLSLKNQWSKSRLDYKEAQGYLGVTELSVSGVL